jgi:competence protein ComEA
MKKTVLFLMLLAGMLFALNFNTATKQELMKIKGIGPKKAEAIIQYRKTHKITNINDLKNIKGFNTKSISKIKDQLSNTPNIQSTKTKKQLKKKYKNSKMNADKKGLKF